MPSARQRPWRVRLATLAVAVLALAGGATAASTGVAHAGPAYGTRLLAGSEWLGGRGVDVYSNNTYSYWSGESSYLGGTYVGVKWQCVELAQRLYTARGWNTGSFGISYAYQIADRASALGMTFHPNGSGYVPVPGDMVIHGSTGAEPAGHVAIVDAVSTSAVGVVEQNWGTTQAGRSTYTRSGTTLSRGSSVIRGVVHDPDNRASTPTELLFTTSLRDRSGGYVINSNPVHKQRTMFVQIFNAQNQLVLDAPANAVHRTGTSEYTGTIVAPSTWPSGYYTVKLRMDYTLVKQVDGIVTITGGQRNAIPLVKPYVGDTNQDNKLDNTDYNTIVRCQGSTVCSAGDKRGSDVDDNGVVDWVDVNLLQRQRFCNPGPCTH